ncbi:hypothetical protein Hanom_Chr07g00666011 [Helianthus anomalus]
MPFSSRGLWPLLPFSSGSISPSIFLREVRGIFVFFVNLKGNRSFDYLYIMLNACT